MRAGRRKPKRAEKRDPTSAVLGASGTLVQFKGEQIYRTRIAATPQLFSTSAAGVIAGLYSITPANIGNFATRFANTWLNYRILKADFEIIAIAAVNGTCTAYMDVAESPLTPTASLATEATSSILQLNIAAPKSHMVMRFVSKELIDLEFRDCGSPVGIGALCLYRDNAFNGASTVSTPVLLVRPYFEVEFKSIRS
jgi:hypothetical protein